MCEIQFQIQGQAAMWHVTETIQTNFSAPIPSPSNVAGLVGAALGLGFTEEDHPHAKKVGPAFALAASLLEWEREAQPEFCIGLLPGWSRRSWNTNGLQSPSGDKFFQMAQKILWEPSYCIRMRWKPTAALSKEVVMARLKEPVFPVYLGQSHYRGYISNVSEVIQDPESVAWAEPIACSCGQDYQTNTRHCLYSPEKLAKVKVRGEGRLKRVHYDGYLAASASNPVWLPATLLMDE
jgi:CRISPR-associated Cas5-like protein